MSKLYVEIRSGLGNQLFQFAFGYVLAKEFGKELILCPVYFDRSWKYWIKKMLGREVRTFRLPLIIKESIGITASDVDERAVVVLRENEDDVRRIRNVLSGEGDAYLKGYWQRPEFFDSCRVQLAKLIHPTFPLSKMCRNTLQLIEENVVGVHVRRGDFLTNHSFGACRIEYYREAIQRMSLLIPSPTFVVFTNNKTWVKENFPKNLHYIIYSNEFNTNSDIEEFYLMTKFKSLIISNSTFSWWAAYLNTTQNNRVVSPTTWFLKSALQKNAGHFIANEWIAIENQLELKR